MNDGTNTPGSSAGPITASVAKRGRGRPRKVVLTPPQQLAPPIERPPMRAEMREDDPRARAARRAAEIKGSLTNLDEGVDEFAIDPSRVPEGWTYEWKRKSVIGQEDHGYMVKLKTTGWEPVPASRMPDLMPIGHAGSIERKGMILMERPKEITDEVRALDRRRARDNIKIKEQQLSSAPDGQFGRDHAQVKPSIKKDYSPVEIPKD